MNFDLEKSSTEELLPALNRKLPFSDEAERGILSCLLQDPENRITEARRVLPVEAFYHSAWRSFYEVLLAMDARTPRVPIEFITVMQHLRDKELLDLVGGPATVSDLFSFTPTSAHFPFYLRMMRDKHTQRRLVRVGAEIAHSAFEWEKTDASSDDIIDLVSGAEAKTFAVLEAARGQTEHANDAKPASVGVAEWIEYNERIEQNRGRIVGVETGILELDSTFHGIDDSEGELVVFAGRPGRGKTALACSIAHHLAVDCGVPGVVFSIEMTGNQFYIRMLLGMASVDTSKAFTGNYSRADGEALQVQVAKTSRAPLWVCDNAALNEMEILAQLQFLKRKHGIRWFMVDHLHKVRHTNPRIQADERVRLVSVMETLRYAKKELRLAGFILVQLSRETDRNKTSAPMLVDLSGSGAIEQDTEGVVVIDRPCMHTPWHKLSADAQQAWRELVAPRRDRNPANWSDGSKYSDDDGGWARQDYEEDAILYVLKNRRGPTPELHVRYMGEYTRFKSRMPKLNSNDWRDHQIGTYRAKGPSSKPAHEAKKAGSFAKKSFRRQEDSDPNWDADFQVTDEPT